MPWSLTVLALLLLGSLAYASASGAPWVPTWKKDLQRLKQLLPLTSTDRFIELGCGNGRVCRWMARESEARIEGLELSLIQWVVASLQSWRYSNVRIRFGNVFANDLSSYTAIYLFLLPETYQKLKEKFEQELKPGTRVVTYVWPIPGWTPVRVDKAEGQPDLFLYVMN